MKPRVCLVGQVIVDVLHFESGLIPRLGGIFHAAKTLSALGCDFDVAYIAPKYLDLEVAAYAEKLSAVKVLKLGEVEGCPNVLFVGEPKEAGYQQYEFLLDRQQRCRLNLSVFEKHVVENPPTDVIVFPGGFALREILSILKNNNARVHVDANFEPKRLNALEVLGRPLETLIVSTSSDTFSKTFEGDCIRLCGAGLRVAKSFLLKENRGGSRYFRRQLRRPVLVPSFPRKIIHSVGVGDSFNSTFVCLSRSMSTRVSLFYSSLIAAEYASVLDFALFKRAVKRTLKIPQREVTKLRGICLPWESRRNVHIYIAAPDFKSVDRTQIERVVSCLKYHNFRPRRPVMEHGEITASSSLKERSITASSDIRLLNQCRIVLAVLPFDDPGTYMEMGFALQRGMPVIVYCSNRISDNLLTYELPTLVSSDLDKVITEVFTQAANIHANRKF